jgi:hypothetical protein
MNAWFVVLNAWIVVMIVLLGVLALTLDRYNDVLRVLTWIAIGWFVLGAFLLGYSGEHL